MIRIRILMIIAVVASFVVAASVSTAQDGGTLGVVAFNGGVFVTPVPGAPFSAEAEQDVTQVLKDGSSFRRKTSALIARDSQGRIHNELREVLPASSTRTPIIYAVHIYDPETRLSTFLNPNTHIARQRTLPKPPAIEPPSNGWLHEEQTPDFQVQDLGSSVMDGVDVHGFRRINTIPGKSSGTGRAVVVTEEVWYSEELHINILTRRTDSRTGELTVRVTKINANEPEADLFTIPPGYKLVDLTPPEPESQNPLKP